jgi:gentisate 1,2-dioxygenase
MSETYLRAYEYESNVNPQMLKIPISSKNITKCPYGITPIDFSEFYHAQHPATSPNLLASFIRLSQNQTVHFNPENNRNNLNASSHFFYLMHGTVEITTAKSNTQTRTETFQLKAGDIFIHPCLSSMKIVNTNQNQKNQNENQHQNETHIYYINDAPLLQYLGSIPKTQTFQPAIYTKEYIETQMQLLANPNNNRKGILFGNEDTEKIGNNTITPVLWSLFNELPPQTRQKPHRHNSVALDLCISCDDEENVYTLMGEALDEHGNILKPTKVYWKKSEMFITPPGLWHSHHNDGDTYAYVLPIQDAGLLLYQRILGIELYK